VGIIIFFGALAQLLIAENYMGLKPGGSFVFYPRAEARGNL